jgi:hypothetical protein
MMRRLLIALFVAVLSRPALAGAWTQNEGATQIIMGSTYSAADESFSASGLKPVSFAKLWSSVWAEYGWSDDLTLIASPEYAWARTQSPTQPRMQASDFAFGGGLRYLLTDSFGELSVQATVKSAGAFDMSVAVDHQAGEEAELRLLYGKNFTLFGRDAFVDAEIGERYIAGARPNETPVDLTLGVYAFHDILFLTQSFNVIAGGDARPPYTYYRSHKLASSVVIPIGKVVSLQIGGFVSPTGQNALQEEGGSVALWLKF